MVGLLLLVLNCRVTFTTNYISGRVLPIEILPMIVLLLLEITPVVVLLLLEITPVVELFSLEIISWLGCFYLY